MKQLLCGMCDGYGIMTLMPGEIIAPCLSCSADKKLEDLEHRKWKAICYEEREKEQILIREHNAKMKDLV